MCTPWIMRATGPVEVCMSGWVDHEYPYCNYYLALLNQQANTIAISVEPSTSFYVTKAMYIPSIIL